MSMNKIDISIYYDIKEDLEKYPDAWAYFIFGGRGRGKTYGTMNYVKSNNEDFVFLKRNIEDIQTLCAGGKDDEVDINLSPFKALNRDKGWNVKALSIAKGIGGFWDVKDGEFSGPPLGWLFALNGVTKYKGFELASDKENQFMIFDEFVPNIYDRISRNEGKQLLDFYKTVSRDRIQRGLNEIKLICLSNATNINSPIVSELNITDYLAEMEMCDEGEMYIEEKKILLRKLPPFEDEAEKETGLYKAMRDTDWGEMTWGNHFAYNDFSNVQKINLKNYTPVCSFIYKREIWYLYRKDGYYYMTRSRHNAQKQYNLNRENEQKKAWLDILYDLRCRTIEEKVRYQTYSMYDLVVNYKQIFKL